MTLISCKCDGRVYDLDKMRKWQPTTQDSFLQVFCPECKREIWNEGMADTKEETK